MIIFSVYTQNDLDYRTRLDVDSKTIVVEGVVQLTIPLSIEDINARYGLGEKLVYVALDPYTKELSVAVFAESETNPSSVAYVAYKQWCRANSMRIFQGVIPAGATNWKDIGVYGFEFYTYTMSGLVSDRKLEIVGRTNEQGDLPVNLLGVNKTDTCWVMLEEVDIYEERV